jgi:hypothetical protein
VNGGVEKEAIFKPVTDSLPYRLNLPLTTLRMRENTSVQNNGIDFTAAKASKRYGVKRVRPSYGSVETA